MFLSHLLGRLELLFAALGDRTARALGRLTQHHSFGLGHSEEQVWVQLGEARVTAEHNDGINYQCRKSSLLCIIPALSIDIVFLLAAVD